MGAASEYSKRRFYTACASGRAPRAGVHAAGQGRHGCRAKGEVRQRASARREGAPGHACACVSAPAWGRGADGQRVCLASASGGERRVVTRSVTNRTCSQGQSRGARSPRRRARRGRSRASTGRSRTGSGPRSRQAAWCRAAQTVPSLQSRAGRGGTKFGIAGDKLVE